MNVHRQHIAVAAAAIAVVLAFGIGPAQAQNKCLAGKTKCVNKKVAGLPECTEKCQKDPAKCGALLGMSRQEIQGCIAAGVIETADGPLPPTGGGSLVGDV